MAFAVSATPQCCIVPQPQCNTVVVAQWCPHNNTERKRPSNLGKQVTGNRSGLFTMRSLKQRWTVASLSVVKTIIKASIDSLCQHHKVCRGHLYVWTVTIKVHFALTSPHLLVPIFQMLHLVIIHPCIPLSTHFHNKYISVLCMQTRLQQLELVSLPLFPEEGATINNNWKFYKANGHNTTN